PGRGHVVPEDLELGHQALGPDGERLRVRRARQDQRKQELAPREREDNDAGCEQSRRCEGQKNVSERRPPARAVGKCGLLDLTRYLREKALQHPDRERQIEQRIDEDQRERLVVEPDGPDDREVRHDDRDWREEAQRECPVEDAGPYAGRDIETCDRIRDEEADRQSENHRRAADDDAVAEQDPHAAVDEHICVWLQRRGLRKKAERGLEQLTSALQRRDDEPVDRKRVHNKDHREQRDDQHRAPAPPAGPHPYFRSSGSTRVTSEYTTLMAISTTTASAAA